MDFKLDKIDKRILYELDKNARIPETKLAKIIGRSRETINYRIKKLEKEKIILGYTCFVNVSKLGYRGYKIYLKIKENPKRKKEFFEQMKKRTDLFWFGIGEGAWDVGLTFFAKDDMEFYKEKNKLFSEFGDIIIDKKTGTIFEPIIFGRKFFYEQGEEKGVHLFGRIENNKIDEIDLKIINEIFQNSRIKLVKLASNINSTIDIVKSRIKKMEKLGIFTKYLAIINYNKLGLEFYKTFLYFDGFSTKEDKRLYQFAKDHENIVHMVRQITPWDVELEIMVENYSRYNEILHQIRKLFPENLKNMESTLISEDHLFPSRRIELK